MTYYDFIQKYFPNSGASDKIEILYRKIEEINTLYEIFQNHTNFANSYLNEDKIIYLKRHIVGLNRLLIYVPLNDDIGIDACMRYSVEQFLKFLYGIYFDKDINKINKTSFRNIKDDFKELTNLDARVSECLTTIYNLYGKYSNNIHKNCALDEDRFKYLSEILTSETGYAYKIQEDIDKIFSFFATVMASIFEIKMEGLSSSERLRLYSGLKRKKYNYVIELLK